MFARWTRLLPACLLQWLAVRYAERVLIGTLWWAHPFPEMLIRIDRLRQTAPMGWRVLSYVPSSCWRTGVTFAIGLLTGQLW